MVSPDALLAAAGGAAAILLLVVYVVSRVNVDNVEKVAGWARRGAESVRREAQAAEARQAVQSAVATGAQQFQKQYGENFLDRGLRIEANGSASVELKDGEIAVAIDGTASHATSTATAVMLYMPQALMTGTRRQVEPRTMRAIDLTFGKGILKHASGPGGAFDAFMDEHDRVAEADPELDERLQVIDWADAQAWMLSTLLPEYRRLGGELKSTAIAHQLRAETHRFAEWLGDIAKKPSGKPATVPLTYPGSFFRVAIVLVGPGRLSDHKARIKERLDNRRIDVVYAMAWGSHTARVEFLYRQLRAERRDLDRGLTRCQLLALRDDLPARLGLTKLVGTERAVARFVALRETRDPHQVIHSSGQGFTLFPVLHRRRQGGY